VEGAPAILTQVLNYYTSLAALGHTIEAHALPLKRGSEPVIAI